MMRGGMTRSFIALWLLAWSPLALAAPRDWQVDYPRSQIRFVIQQMNVPVEGGVNRFSASARFDPAKPESGVFRVELDMASVDTGTPDGDGEARRPLWFDVGRHPRATFVSRSVQKQAEGRYQATGDLTLKGRSKAVNVPFTLVRQAGEAWLAEGRLPISRADFGIGGGDWNDVVADRAEARFRIWLKP
jgi:polyisoprenoid-binding protein YceI